MVSKQPEPEKERQPREAAFRDAIGSKEVRKLKARRQGHDDLWFGLGMFGLIGWSVAIPTLLGVALGLWIDATWPSRFAWTLMLLLLGMMLGCLNAWYWVTRESAALASEDEEPGPTQTGAGE